MKRVFFALAASCLLAGTASAADLVVKIGTVVSGQHPENVGAMEIKRLIEERSNGDIEVRVFTDGQLGNQREMVEQLRDGTLEITWVTTGFFGSWEPVLNTLEIGFLFEDREHSFAAFDGPLGEEVASLVNNHGVELLGFYEAGMRHVTNNVRAIENVEDLAGLKIRTPEAKYHPSTLERMGASPTPMAFNELYAAMEQGMPPTAGCGMGVDRLAMLKYGVPDLRPMFEADTRWLAHYGFSAFAAPNPASGLS